MHHQTPLAPERTAFIDELIARGGPEPHEYAAFTAWIDALAEDVKTGRVAEEEAKALARKLSVPGSWNEHVTTSPHGYPGDFEIIDGIHCEIVNRHPRASRWDSLFQAQSASKAVRNRKQYFQELLRARCGRNGHALPVLNVASGPGRDVREWLDANGPAAAHFDCVDLDANAIRFAESLCAGYAEAVRFFLGNALLFKAPRRYGLVWSGGLFDYLEDRLFVRLLRRLLRFTEPGGEVVVGNFGDYNPTRNYMELLGGWRLIHRSREYLHALAAEAGAAPESVSIGVEPEGVNLFLHIRA